MALWTSQVKAAACDVRSVCALDCGCAAAGVEPGFRTAVGEKKRGQSPSIAGGEGGIRTHEGLLTLAGFQDQCIQPLCHLSTRKNAANRRPRQRPKAQAAPACVARAVPASGLPLLVFKTSAFNRSATSPHEKTLPIEHPDNALKLKPHRPVSPGLSLHAVCPCWFSRPVHSTALPALRQRSGRRRIVRGASIGFNRASH